MKDLPVTNAEAAAPRRSFFGDLAAAFRDATAWSATNPAGALLLFFVIATLVYFFGYLPLFVRGSFNAGTCSVAAWAWQAWNPTANQEHSKLVPFISLALIWYHRDKIRRAEKRGSNMGLLWLAIGILFYVLSARCLQPRMALVSVPFLIYGAVQFLWGKKVARIILFPCAFLIFMVPVAAIEQGTFRLQFIITDVVGVLCNAVGIKIQALGTTLPGADGSFIFQIAEGCSGFLS